MLGKGCETPTGGYKAATDSPLVGTWGAAVVEDAEASFLEANEQFSILSSRFICCCRHSRLQKALSPLQNIYNKIIYYHDPITLYILLIN